MWFADDGAKSRSRSPSRGQDGGFTLVEMLMVIVILGILAAVVVFAVGSMRGDATSAACAHDKRAVESALEAHAVHNGSYPSTLADLLTNPASLKSAQISGNRLTGEDYFLDYDPANHGLTCSVAAPSAGGGGGGGGGAGGGGGGGGGGSGGGGLADTVSPTSAHALSGTAGFAGWHRSNVTVALTATDAGTPVSGVATMTYRMTGATSLAATTVSGASASRVITADGTTTVFYRATDAAGNVEAEKSFDVKIDQTLPGLTVAAISNGTMKPDFSGTRDVASAASADLPTVTVKVFENGGTSAIRTFTDSSTGSTWSTAFTGGALSNKSSFTAEVTQSDAAGNTRTVTRSWTT